MTAPPLLPARPMASSDLPAVQELDASCQGHPWSLESFLGELERGESGLSLVRPLRDGGIAGYLCAWTVLDELHVGLVGVLPGLRRSGIGRDLMEDAHRWARSRGAAIAHLEVRAGNTAAIGLYEGLGYRRVGVRRGYYQDNGEDAHLLLLDFPKEGAPWA